MNLLFSYLYATNYGLKVVFDYVRNIFVGLQINMLQQFAYPLNEKYTTLPAETEQL